MNRRRFALSALALATGACLAPRAQAAEIEWRYFGVIVPAHDFAKIMIEGFNRVEQRSNGRFKIQYVTYGETPYKAVDGLTLLRDGLVQMTEWLPGYNAATYPLLSGPELPLIATKWEMPEQLQAATDAAWGAPTMKAYFQKVLDQYNAQSLARVYYEPINIWFKDVVTTVDGIKGKKVRASTPEQAEWLSGMGASPVNISAADAYQGLQRGVIDGIITGSGAVISFKWNEVLKSGFATNVVMSSTHMLASKRAIAQLPADLRTIFAEEMANVEKRIREYMPNSDRTKQEQLRAAGMTITQPGPELYARFRKFAEDNVYASWKKRAGAEADKFLAEVSSIR